MMRSCCVTIGVFVLGLASASPGLAQDVPYVELSAGYNFMRYQELVPADAGDQVFGVNLPSGLYGDVAVNANHAVGFVGLLTMNRPAEGGSGNLVSFMGGLRFSSRGFARGPGRTIGFFQLLGGLVGTKIGGTTYTDRALQIGGGANITVTDHAGIRVEADYIRTFNREAPTVGANYIRFSLGGMYGFGAH